MSAPRTMPDILERLLTDPRFRADFIAGRSDLPAAFQTVDPVQLVRTADQLAKDLLQRQFRGSGGLLSRYPRTLAAVPAGGLEALMSDFVASAPYRDYREWPREGRGRCLEEVFYRFAEEIDLGDPAEREAEFLAAMIRAVLLSPDPGFALPPELVRRANGVVFAVGRRGDPPQLFAATPRGLVQGPLTRFLADLLGDEAPEAVARRYRVSVEILGASLRRLGELGLR